MEKETGNLSINSENILPIIKKWLYSDTDIFIRELVSNATDAIRKHQKLVDMGEATAIENDPYKIYVILDKENKTIEFIDNGIGMTTDEIKQYINQIAFSGASDFVNKYKDKMDQGNEIIGHFGLGFYSAFMVADKVEIDSLSYQENAVAAKWICEGGIDFEMSDGERSSRGTTITLFVGESGIDFLDEYKIRQTLNKYCGFMPIDIYLEVVKVDEPEVIDADADIEDSDDTIDDAEEKEAETETPINNTNPLWLKKSSECTDEEYKDFYRNVFTDFNEPLFWIHLNMDYPFRLKGILYFPKLKHELESIEGQVKLYSNQVFIADNIKEVIPEFLLLLKGAIDCPDLPLNVSRSFLQNDGYVSKMSAYITKKVADKLESLFKKNRETYNKYWDDINPFIRYGCIKERDFYDKVKHCLIYKTTENEYLTTAEFCEKNKEKTDKTVYYVTDEKQQAQYIKVFKDQGMEAVILSTRLDNAFISYLESYDRDVKFARIDSELSESLKNKEESTDDKTTEELQTLFREKLGNDKLKINVESLKSDSVSAMILLSEQSRRMKEMSTMFGGMGDMYSMFQNDETLVLNKNNSLVKALLNMKDDEAKKDDTDLICHHIYDLAMMSHKPLEMDAMTKFIERSNTLLSRIATL